jgi:glycosyltransferase involved in cell wall biosynthesis
MMARAEAIIMPEPTIDVLIPVFNGEQTIISAVQSIQRQSYDNLVIHVIDDGSTDATNGLLVELARTDQRIKVHTQPNGGIVSALNRGLTYCSAPYLARHDADDLADPDRLRIQLDYLETHPECVAVGCAVRHIDSRGAPTGSIGRLPSPDDADPNWAPAREPYIIHPFLLARRDALVQLGGYRHVYNSEDSDLYWRLSTVGRLHNLPAILGNYRIHDQSLTGGSIVNGRLLAVYSQLAAISARRRRAGVVDFVFEKGLLQRLRDAGNIVDMASIAEAMLHQNECRHFRLAVAAKILELTAYRPYELDMFDCKFIQAANHDVKILQHQNITQFRRQIAGAAARMSSRRQFREAFTLLTLSTILGFLVRFGARMILPKALRIGFRKAFRASEAVK